MIKLKTKEQIAKLRVGGQKLAQIVDATAKQVKVGISGADLNDFAANMMAELGVKSSFLNYRPAGARTPFPASICVSINDEIVHGIPTESKKVKEGDIVKIDAGVVCDGLFTDHAVTVIVGEVPKEIRELVNRTKEALSAGIKQCRIGNHVGDIGSAIEKAASKSGITVVNDLTGHGVGFAVHEDPFVPNTGKFGPMDLIQEGLVIAVEPMFTLGDPHIIVARDGHTYKTRDGSVATQFEHTIAITKQGPIILTAK